MKISRRERKAGRKQKKRRCRALKINAVACFERPLNFGCLNGSWLIWSRVMKMIRRPKDSWWSCTSKVDFFLEIYFFIFFFFWNIIHTHTCSYKFINTFTTFMNTFERLSGKYWDWWNQHKSRIVDWENIRPLNFSKKNTYADSKTLNHDMQVSLLSICKFTIYFVFFRKQI